ncbi:MAG: acyl-CoA dehydrogenase family protein, partial [Alphaproteobacteria bacterium]
MPLDRAIFEAEHELFRETCRRFLEKEVTPFHADWEKAGVVPREAWTKAAAAGLLLPTTSTDYGGAGG